MIDEKNFFDHPIRNNKVTYENIRKIAIGQGNDYTTGCLLDYTYFKKYYKMTAIDLSKQQALDVDPRAIQQINFTANLDRDANTRFYFILEFSQRNRKSFINFNFYQYRMIQYNRVNSRLSNSQLNKLKSAIKNETEVVLRLFSNMIGDNEANFPHQLLLTNTQVSNLREAFSNNSSVDIKFSKT